MKLGIVGLPNVGKSTLFNSLTKAGALAANYPFATIDPNVGIVAVPDERLDVLTKMYNSAKTTPAVIEFVDIAGLVRGASKGEGLGNQFLSHIRECDAIVHVVRCFDDPDVVHVDGSIDPIRDIETINIELIFSDLEVLERRISKTVKLSRNDKQAAKELEFQNRIKAHLEAGNPVRTFEINEADDDEKAWIHDYFLLTDKKVIYAANVSEDDMADEDMGLKESGLDKLVRASYSLLGLISYLTAGETESRAWTITEGTKAPQAAGKIHSDFERGFIKAEVIAYDDLIREGSMTAAKEKGLVRQEGKEYVMKDGDVVLFKFNV